MPSIRSHLKRSAFETSEEQRAKRRRFSSSGRVSHEETKQHKTAGRKSLAADDPAVVQLNIPSTQDVLKSLPLAMTFPSPRKPPRKREHSDDDKENLPSEASPPFFSPRRRVPTGVQQLTSRKRNECVSAYCPKCVPKITKSSFKNIDDTPGRLLTSSHRLQMPLIHTDTSHRGSCRGLSLDPILRSQMINFMVHVQSTMPHPLADSTLHVAISAFDRFCFVALRRGHRRTRDNVLKSIPAVAGAALFLASKVEDVWPLDAKDIVASSTHAYSSDELLTWERRICLSLDFQISQKTSLEFVYAFLNEEACLRRHMSRHCCHESEQCCCETCTICSACTYAPSASTEGLSRHALGLFYEPREDWHPKHRQGLGRSSVEACVLFLLELFQAHPLSVNLAYDLIAASCLLVVLEILKPHPTLDPSHCMPPSGMSVLSKDCAVADECVGSIMGAYVEHEAAEAAALHERDSSMNAVIASCLPSETETGTTLYREAMEEPDDDAREIQLAAYLIQAVHAKGHRLPASKAKSTAQKIINGTFSVDHPERSIASPCPFPADLQQPMITSVKQPFGRFAMDVECKHLDAAAYFREKFREWKGNPKELLCRSKPVVRETRRRSLSACTPAAAKIRGPAIYGSAAMTAKNDSVSSSRSTAPGTSEAVPLSV